MQSTGLTLDSVSNLSKLAFEAERVEWSNFKTPSNHSSFETIFAFGRAGNDANISACDILSIAPNSEIARDCYSQAYQASKVRSQTECDWNLVSLYHFHLRYWYYLPRIFLEVLFKMEKIDDFHSPKAGDFLSRLQDSSLYYVLLTRRRGAYWERVGSGLMFKESWPSTSIP